jgi:hypothetical protein
MRQRDAAGMIDCHGTRKSADKSNAVLRRMIVGVANAAPASAARSEGLAATSVRLVPIHSFPL